MSFIHSAFSLYFLVVIFQSKIVRFLLHPVVGMSCFVWIVLAFVDISLIFLLSPILSGLFPQLVLLSFLVSPFLFCSYIFQRLSLVLSFSPVFEDFLSAFPVEIHHTGFDFFFLFFEGIPILSQTNLVQHRLVHLIRLYYLLIYKVILDLFYSFPS